MTTNGYPTSTDHSWKATPITSTGRSVTMEQAQETWASAVSESLGLPMTYQSLMKSDECDFCSKVRESWHLRVWLDTYGGADRDRIEELLRERILVSLELHVRTDEHLGPRIRAKLLAIHRAGPRGLVNWAGS
jgi:hypothetical protein